MKHSRFLRASACFLALPAIVLALAPRFAAAQGFDHGFYVPINDLTLTGPLGGRVVVNGNAVIGFAGADFFGTVDHSDTLLSFDSTIPLHSAFTAEFEAKTSGEFSGSIPIPLLALPSFPIGVDIMVFPWVYGSIEFSGSAEAGAKASVVLPMEIEVGVSIPGHPLLSIFQPLHVDPTFGPPDAANAAGFDVRVGSSIGICFIVVIKGIIVGGPAVKASLGIDFSIDPLSDPWWDADGYALLNVSWGMPDPSGILSQIPTAGITLSERHFEIGKASGPIVNTPPSTRWSRIYDLANFEDATAVIPVTDGFLVFGNGAGIGNRSYVALLDGNGVPQWEKLSVPQPFGSMRPTAACRASNGELTVCGNTVTSGGMRVDRYSSAGTPLWTKTMGSPGLSLESWTCLVPTSTDGAILGGNVTHVGTPNIARPIFAEITSTGSLAWVTEIDLGAGASSPGIAAMARTPSGDLLAVGSVNYADGPDMITSTIWGKNALVVRLDSQGNVLSAKAIGAVGWETVGTIAVSPDGSYAIGGTVPSIGLDAEEHSAWIAGFDANDQLQWSCTYAGEIVNGSAGDTSTDTILGLSPLEGGGYLVSGATSSSTPQDAWLLRVDDMGMPVWFKSLRGDDIDSLRGIVTLEGDGLIAYGSTKSENAVAPSTQGDLWIVRTSVDGMLAFAPGVSFDAFNDQAQWSHATYTSVHTLAPSTIAATLDFSTSNLAVAAAFAVVTLLTQ